MGENGAYQSLIRYSDDWLVNTVIMLLIIIGGIGFLVWDDLSVKKFQWKKYHLHTKIVLSTTGFLIIGGAVLFLILEKNNVLGRDACERTDTLFFISLGDSQNGRI